MTLPRRILPGTTYLVTRRCTQRRFLLVPRKPVREVFGYCLAVAARRHGIQLHGFAVLSNHHHLVLTDPRAELPAFLQLLHSLVARALNCHYGRWENLWSSQRPSVVELPTATDVRAKLV